MFVANRQRTRHQDCGNVPVTYYRDFLDDVRDRAGRVSEDGRAFSVSRLALRCQREATRFAPVRS
jgi:hypothetical protein